MKWAEALWLFACSAVLLVGMGALSIRDLRRRARPKAPPTSPDRPTPIGGAMWTPEGALAVGIADPAEWELHKSASIGGELYLVAGINKIDGWLYLIEWPDELPTPGKATYIFPIDGGMAAD